MSSHVVTGSVIAGFRVVALIGEGATAVVYLAEAVDTGKRVALKVLSPELAQDERFRRRFLRESQLAASLDHAHVVPTIAAGETDSGVLFLAMAYVEGSDLRGMLQREGRLAPERAVALVGQVAEALDAAHAAGLVHRDVKPGNILVTSDSDGEHAYVCDFGLARHVSSVSSLTGDRGFVGTIDYVPPEQILGNQIDRRSDLYSLGCVLFECLVGAKPFERESELSVVFAHLNEPPPRPTAFCPELPAAWDDFFAKSLAKEPSERFGSGRELVEAARAAAAGKRRPSRRVRAWVIAVAVAAAIAAAVGAGFALHGGVGRHARPRITESAIASATLGRPPRYYKKQFGPYRGSTASGPNYPTLAFQQPEVAVYFPAPGRPAHIITTWNGSYRTAAGIGPCSTLAAAKHAYGARWKPSPHGVVLKNMHGVHSAYVVGNNLIFETQDGRTISAVGLYHGGDDHPQAFANYITANETACK